MNQQTLLKTVQELRELIVGCKPSDLREALIILNCLYSEVCREIEMEKHRVYDPAMYVLDFGKHNGKTVAEVGAVDPSYLEWLYESYPYKGTAFKMMIHECLTNSTRVCPRE